MQGLILRNNKGFSMVEMLLASVIFVGLSAVSYTFLQSQQTRQLSAVKSQFQNRASSTAIDRFKTDAMMVDPNWINMGIPVVFPHQGYGYGSNYYSDLVLQTEEALPDGVTFLVRDSEQDAFVNLTDPKNNDKLCIGKQGYNGYSSAHALFGYAIGIDDADSYTQNDWVLIFEDGHSVLGIIEDVGLSTMTLRAPNASEKQLLQENGNNQETGLVQKAGVLTSTIDIEDAIQNNEFHCFSSKKLKMQRIGHPISYEIRYATDDGKQKNPANIYLLNENGQKKKMLTRIEYTGQSIQSEYLAEVENVEFTYDVILPNSDDVVTNIGRGDSSDLLLDTALDYSQPEQVAIEDGDAFRFSGNIISINLNILNHRRDPKDVEKVIVKNHQIKASFDSITGQNSIVESVDYESFLTESLSFSKAVSNAYDENVGRPFYLKNPGDNHEMLVPVWRHMTNGDIFSEATGQTINDAGRISVFDSAGCPVNPFTVGGCDVSNNSSVEFQPVETGSTLQTDNGVFEVESKFFPTTVNSLAIDGYRVLVVGGVSLTGVYDPAAFTAADRDSDLYWDAARPVKPGSAIDVGIQQGAGADPNATVTVSGQLDRTAGFATILLPEEDDLGQYILDNTSVSNAGACSVSGCDWESIQDAPDNGSGNAYEDDLSGLKDTANISVTKDGKLLVVPMTKKAKDAATGIYEVNITLVPGPNSEKIAKTNIFHKSDIQVTQNNSIVTAVAERTVEVDGKEYLPVCTSKELPICDYDGNCSPVVKSYGEVRLINVTSFNQGSPDNVGIKIAEHNYACNAMTVTDKEDLLISGRLSIVPLTNLEMSKMISGNAVPPTIYLDDIAMVDDQGVPVYAHGFEVDPDTYEDSNFGQVIGWRSGVSSVSFDGQIGLVGTNTVRLGNNDGGFSERIDVGIHMVDLPSSSERVLVSIQTDVVNVNETSVSATFLEVSNDEDVTPATFIPGNYIVDENNLRTNPTPLPSLGAAMSELDWYQLFTSLQKPKGEVGLDSDMPVIPENYVAIACENAFTQTCQSSD